MDVCVPKSDRCSKLPNAKNFEMLRWLQVAPVVNSPKQLNWQGWSMGERIQSGAGRLPLRVGGVEPAKSAAAEEKPQSPEPQDGFSAEGALQSAAAAPVLKPAVAPIARRLAPRDFGHSESILPPHLPMSEKLGRAQQLFFEQNKLIGREAIDAELRRLLARSDLKAEDIVFLTDRLANVAQNHHSFDARDLFMGARLAAQAQDLPEMRKQVDAVMAAGSSVLSKADKRNILTVTKGFVAASNTAAQQILDDALSASGA